MIFLVKARATVRRLNESCRMCEPLISRDAYMISSFACRLYEFVSCSNDFNKGQLRRGKLLHYYAEKNFVQ